MIPFVDPFAQMCCIFKASYQQTPVLISVFYLNNTNIKKYKVKQSSAYTQIVLRSAPQSRAT